eukprot:gnl/TRDRNA2_/TRDRNA2_153657_c5_seq2.p1 gnl/TRDRNA2_/TRDRNA2_153657_c5~~gnl/TRDRNA2_/TRDRNA2_153657_c5_seq2.p1  ORF type:complete len:112 (+),score=3.65 gnl/TRDRNA2_/TRDRNA2_153657_c5_seq2:89-424(+)
MNRTLPLEWLCNFSNKSSRCPAFVFPIRTRAGCNMCSLECLRQFAGNMELHLQINEPGNNRTLQRYLVGTNKVDLLSSMFAETHSINVNLCISEMIRGGMALAGQQQPRSR